MINWVRAIRELVQQAGNTLVFSSLIRVALFAYVVAILECLQGIVQVNELKGISLRKFFILSICLASTFVNAGVAYEACSNMPSPIMNSVSCMSDTLASVDKALESTQEQLVTLSKNSYQVSPKEYVRIHHAFLDYRERQCGSFGESVGRGGTGAGTVMLSDDCMIELTNQRIEYLRQIIDEYYK